MVNDRYFKPNSEPTACLLQDGMVSDVRCHALQCVRALQDVRYCTHATRLGQNVALAERRGVR